MVYLIEPKRSADGTWQQTAVQTGGKVVFENDAVRVIEHSARPRMGVCGEGLHTHPDHLTIVVVGGRIKIMKPDHEPIIRESPAGAVFWDPSGPHAIQNMGSRNARALLIEFKSA